MGIENHVDLVKSTLEHLIESIDLYKKSGLYTYKEIVEKIEQCIGDYMKIIDDVFGEMTKVDEEVKVSGTD